MNETAAKAMPSTSHSHGNGLNGACSAGFAERAATLNSLEGLADEASKRFAASSLETWLRSARRVRHRAHESRCACTEARASDESAPSRYAERSPNGCTA